MDHTEKLLLRASEVSELAGLGKSKTYELIAAGILPSVRIGKSVRVPAGQLREWIERLPSRAPANEKS
jgi:excisionase family DNA binding protein